jgi:hypothetical protein
MDGPLGTSLIRDCLELPGGINKPLPDIVRKLQYSDKITYTIAEAHRGFEYSAVNAM